MNENNIFKASKSFWETFKSIWKKFGGYIATFLAGVLAYFLLDRRGDKRSLEHIAALETRLAEYEQLNNQLRELADELRNRLEKGSELLDSSRLQSADLRGEIDRARLKNDELRIEIERARADIDNLRGSLQDATESAREGRDVTEKLRGQSESIGVGIDRLEGFLKKYGTGDDVPENLT
jgi:chromosome segregation ATPase